MAGGNILTLQRLLGHADLKMTDTGALKLLQRAR
jgi:hypothetical protein